MLKDKLRSILSDAVETPFPGESPNFSIDIPTGASHGDFAANVALILSKKVKMKPVEVAKTIVSNIADPEGLIESSEIAGPGFLNFVIPSKKWIENLKEVRKQGERFGTSQAHRGKKAVVEFVSANPTGPLHVGNARGGPLGDAIVNLLSATGYEVVREFYINDIGGQIDKLGESILAHLQR